jgi:hypothetical protein
VHAGRLAVLAGLGFAGIALFLPFASFPIVGPVDGIEGDAWPVLIPLLPIAVRVAVGNRSFGYRPPSGVAMLGLSGAAIVFAAAKVADASAAVSAAGEGASVGGGAWVLLAATIVVAGGHVVAMLLPPR